MEEYDLWKYDHADKVIQRLTAARDSVWDDLTREQSLCGSIVYDGFDVHMVAPRTQYLIEQADMTERNLTREIARWQMRGKLYRQYKAEHPHQTEQEVQDELQRIDVYVCLHEGVEPPPEPLELTGDADDDVASLAAFFS